MRHYHRYLYLHLLDDVDVRTTLSRETLQLRFPVVVIFCVFSHEIDCFEMSLLGLFRHVSLSVCLSPFSLSFVDVRMFCQKSICACPLVGDSQPRTV